MEFLDQKILLCVQPLRIAVLTLEKELRKRKNAENGDSLDWASYVDLQNSLKILLQTHR